MMIRTMCFVLAVVVALVMAKGDPATANEVSVSTDADATVRVICRNDRGVEDCLVPRGTNTPDGLHPLWGDEFDAYRFIRVHDQNSLDSGYWHFDLSDIDPGSEVVSAKFQLDSQTNSWGDTSVTVVAIMDANQDWDLNALPENEMYGGNAPLADWSDWVDDPNNAKRFNSPTPFLDEGEGADAVARVLVPFPDFVFIEDQDPWTTVDGNAYGGVAGQDGPGASGSADGGTNIWPVKNAVDVDITDLVRWKLGQNPAYSDFDPKDRDLTLMVRTELGVGDNGFVRFISKESGENTSIVLAPEGEPALEPGRIVLSGTIITSPTGPPLQAGDADQDLDFDQFDLILVQQAAKYLTGQAATWGEGDWNGAPGGQQGDPPAGNGLFDQLDIVAALGPGHYLMGPYAAVGPNGTEGDGQTSIVYDRGTGELRVDAPAGTDLTSVNIDSTACIFTGEVLGIDPGAFGNDSDCNIFIATIGGSFGSLSLHNVAQAGLSEEFMLGDLTVVGSLAGGGDLGEVDLICVPEPSTCVLLVVGAVGLIGMARRRNLLPFMPS